ncbi:hypothetical protein HX882_32160 [Pseudomonas gingeri]|uniref:Uncharacterized protein n=1 Tax=Pseudomonas gingeri TaxID=117681 RepID=A0A7Y7XIQ7_9PSED|nr:hypothetical protein [Pseudomonas gingeri]NWC00536.1 hypothetical protein [Pseudomonas gingeri]
MNKTMARSLTAIVKLVLLLVFLVAFYLFFVGVESWRKGYTWKEMDWDQSGSTSVVDFFVASDIGKREIVVNGKKCFEYYAFKDGMTVKIICPK